MKIVIGAKEGRRTLLRRQSWSESTVPDAVWARTREAVGGEVATVEQAVRKILHDVRNEGDAAVLRYCAAFDGASYDTLRVDQSEIKSAYAHVEPAVVGALRFAAERVLSFHQQQREHVMRSFQHDGIGMQVSPLERVGLNAPGTAVVYPSSVLMTAIPANAAGVEEIPHRFARRQGRQRAGDQARCGGPGGRDGRLSHERRAGCRRVRLRDGERAEG